MTTLNAVQTPGAIASRTPFRNSNGSMSADQWVSNYPLPMARAYHANDELFAATWEPGLPLYVVYSYNTPIGWWSEKHGWTIPDHKFSVTTSKHQTYLRRGAGA